MTRADYDIRIDWNNDGDWNDTGENVTARSLARTPITIQYGRDQARSLAPIAPGRAVAELDNTSGDYSPENPSSPLAGNLGPGRPVRITATHNSVEYVLYRGFLDDYDMSPEIEKRSVSFTMLDALARLSQTRISTDLHFSIRTGQAINFVLDAAGWPTEARDIDVGATIIRWWWEEDDDAFAAIKNLLEAEGPPALVTVDLDGKIVFRDRHHRLTRAASLTSQATFRGSAVEPYMAPPLVYDLGWRDIVNSVTISVPERGPEPELSDVWQSSTVYTIADGETLPVTAQTADPFIEAVTPEAGTDFTLHAGVVNVVLSNTYGASATLFITAVGGPAILTDLKLRAYSLSVIHTVQIRVEDSTSIAKHGRRSYGADVPWVGVHDALAVAQLIIAHRSERLPVVSMRITNGHDIRIVQQLSRDLSDRVTIIDTESGLDAEFHIEQVQHRTDGMFHETVFGCEKAPAIVTDVFTLDSTTKGVLGTDMLGVLGIDNPATVFILDDGLLDTEVLAT